MYKQQSNKIRKIFTTDKKWSNYLQLKSYVNNTPVKTAIYNRFTAQHTSIPAGIW